MAMVVNPVFLHGLWRSGSTYVYSRFRALEEQTCCYYEPLQPGLAKLTRERIGVFREDRAAENRHPVMDRPFFYEFSNLLKSSGRGVRHFKRHFEWKDFLLEPTQENMALKSYIDFLIEQATERGKTPVFGFNRTTLRMGWFSQRWPSACHLYIDRDPYDIWASYEGQIETRGNYTFYTSWLRVLEANAAHPLIKPLAARLPLRAGLQKILRKQKSYYRPQIEALSAGERYFMVFYLWALTALHALSLDELHILDMSRVADPAYVEEVCARLRVQTGLDVNFTGLENRPAAVGLLPARDAIEEEVRALIAPLMGVPLFNQGRIQANTSRLAPEKVSRLGYRN